MKAFLTVENLSLLILTILVSLLSFWIYVINNQNKLLALVLIILTFLVTIFFYKISFNKKLLFIITFLFSLVLLFLFIFYFDPSLYKLNNVKQSLIEQRRSYYPKEIGRFFQNRALYFIRNFERNFFYNLDPNQYFFASHPRERGDAYDFEKFFAIFLIPFIAGLYYLLKKNFKRATTTFLVIGLLSAFVDPGNIMGIVSMFPLICATCVIGIYQLLLAIKFKK